MQDVPIIMSAEDVLKNSSLVAIIAAIIGLFILFGDTLFYIGVIFLGVIAVLFGLVNYLKDKKDLLGLVAAVVGIIVIIAAIIKWKF